MIDRVIELKDKKYVDIRLTIYKEFGKYIGLSTISKYLNRVNNPTGKSQITIFLSQQQFERLSNKRRIKKLINGTCYYITRKRISKAKELRDLKKENKRLRELLKAKGGSQ